MSDNEDNDRFADVADDELDIEVRPPQVVAARAIVLSALMQRLALEHSDNLGDAAAEAFDLREWLRGQDLWQAATPAERELLDREVGSLAAEEIAVWSWQGVALALLAWALDLAALAPPGSPPDLRGALARIPTPWDATANWLRDARLEHEDVVIAERERAEIWHWRATAEAARRDTAPDGQTGIQSAIHDVVAEAIATGLVPETSGRDFQVGGRRVFDLGAEALDDLQMTTAGRLRALNWLCGFGDTWDSVPLDV